VDKKRGRRRERGARTSTENSEIKEFLFWFPWLSIYSMINNVILSIQNLYRNIS